MTKAIAQCTFPTRVGRGFSPTWALQTPQCIDIANNDKGAGFKDFVGLKTDLHLTTSAHNTCVGLKTDLHLTTSAHNTCVGLKTDLHLAASAHNIHVDHKWATYT